MRNPQSVLNSLREQSTRPNYKFERLYRIMFNEEMYYQAYQKLYANPGNMTKGSDGGTIDGTSISTINQLIEAIRDESYQPAPSRRVYILKKNGKKRPLGIPSFGDKLVQEVIRMILQSVYESCFEDSSHGFRPKRSCHTALTSIQRTFTGTKWFVEGDIKGFFDNINHGVLIAILSERIADERFLRMIRKFLNAGYMEDWVFNKTHSGTPQGGIISPILANIYLDKLDKYASEYITKFNKGKAKKVNPEYAKFTWMASNLVVRKLKVEQDGSIRSQLLAKIKELKKQRILVPFNDAMDENYRRLKYIRYADDFLIGIIGSKTDAQKVKEDFKMYLSEKLKLELSEQKTLITNAKSPAQFLGYEVSVRKSSAAKRNKNGVLSRTFGERVVLEIGNATMRKKLLDYDAMTISVRSGKEVWKPKSRPCMKNNDDLEILSQYNAEIRGFYNYYSIANNSHTIDSFYNIMEYSMYKTYACKYQTTTRKVIRKYSEGKEFVVKYENKDGKILSSKFYNDGFARKANVGSQPDLVGNSLQFAARGSLVDRLKARKCEFCAATDDLEMHHVRKLKDLKGKQDWEKHMIARRRKTLAVCFNCHRKIHYGKMD
ncbi:reverse transcriptase domain-containing protein [Dyadobacter alkalitolerans]|uniref:reverse transcriptase domain-containing protein n=1 Tax=Dyadobacter alkalitolerans TaxID=492736 RepID=UPI0003F63886|nr:reverse transcriptase domain-containing protein [Dyadobacter alkalitolerans]